MKENAVAAGKSSPLKWVPSVYFAMGLPFIVLNLVAVIMFADLGIDKAQIAFWTSLLTLPYTLKFIWSPLLEIYWTKRNFVVATQAITGFCFGLIAFLLPVPDFFAWTIAIMGVVAFSGATHDIATDGIYLTALDKKTQSVYIGWQGAFYNLAKVLANGGLVALAGVLINYFKESNPERAPFYAWMIIMGIIGALMIGMAVYHFFMLPATPRAGAGESKNFPQAMREMGNVLVAFFKKKYIWLYILFIVCYRLTEGFAMKMVPLFLKASLSEGGLAMSNEDIGLIYGTFGTIAFILGSILGGYYIAHYGLKRVLFSLVCIFSAFRDLLPLLRVPAIEPHADRHRLSSRVFLLRFRLRGPHDVHDAAGGSGQTFDGALRLRFGHHESRSDASRHDQRLDLRYGRLRNVLHHSPCGGGARVHPCMDRALHPFRRLRQCRRGRQGSSCRR